MFFNLKSCRNIVFKWIIISVVLFALFSVSDWGTFNPLGFSSENDMWSTLDPLGFLFYGQDSIYPNFLYYPRYENLIHAIVLGLLLSIIFYFVEIKTEASIKQKLYRNQNKIGLIGAGSVSVLAFIITSYSISRLRGAAAAQSGLEIAFRLIFSLAFISVVTIATTLYSYYIYKKMSKGSAKRK